MSLGYDISIINESRENWSSCVFGYFIDYRTISVGKINQFIRAHWDIRGHILIQKMDDLYVFKCSDERDKNDIIEKSIAFFDGALMVFRDWLPNTPPQTMSFRDAKVWVRVYGLPLEFLNEHIASLVGSMFEEDFSVSNFESCTQNDYLRIRVPVHLDKPLIPGFYLALQDGSLLWVQFKYEEIIKICVRCGKLGHKINGCCETEEKIRNIIDTLMSEVLARGFPILQAEENFPMFKLDLRVNSHVSTSNKHRVRMGLDKTYRRPCIDRRICPGTRFEQGFQPFMGPVLQLKKQGGNECNETVQQSPKFTHSSNSMEEVLESDAAQELTQVENIGNATLISGAVEHQQNSDNGSCIRVEADKAGNKEKGENSVRVAGLELFDIPESGAKSKLFAALPVGNSSDGCLDLIDVYHMSKLGEDCKEEIRGVRKRKCCTDAGDYIIPDSAKQSMEDAKEYLRKLAKRRCWSPANEVKEQNIHQPNWGFRVLVEDVVMVELSDSSLPSVNGGGFDPDFDGFAEVGPSQPPQSP